MGDGIIIVYMKPGKNKIPSPTGGWDNYENLVILTVLGQQLQSRGVGLTCCRAPFGLTTHNTVTSTLFLNYDGPEAQSLHPTKFLISAGETPFLFVRL